MYRVRLYWTHSCHTKTNKLAFFIIANWLFNFSKENLNRSIYMNRILSESWILFHKFWSYLVEMVLIRTCVVLTIFVKSLHHRCVRTRSQIHVSIAWHNSYEMVLSNWIKFLISQLILILKIYVRNTKLISFLCPSNHLMRHRYYKEKYLIMTYFVYKLV